MTTFAFLKCCCTLYSCYVDARRSVKVNQASNYKILDRDCVSEGGEERIHLNDIKEAGLMKWIMN